MKNTKIVKIDWSVRVCSLCKKDIYGDCYGRYTGYVCLTCFEREKREKREKLLIDLAKV